MTARKRLSLIAHGENGLLKIGYMGATMPSILPLLISSFVTKHPAIHLIISEQPNEKLLHSLSNGIIDLAFVRTRLTPKKLEEKLIMQEPLVLVVSDQHRLSNLDPVDIKDLRHETFITFARECGPTIYDEFMGLCANAGFVPDVLRQATQFNSVLRLVECGLGISVMPDSIKNGYNLKLKYIPINNNNGSVPLIMLYRKDNLNSSLNYIVKHMDNELT